LNDKENIKIKNIISFDDESDDSYKEYTVLNHSKLRYGICDLCGEIIYFEDNLTGLTIDGKYFACENCCKKSSKESLKSWSNSKMEKNSNLRPIGLWTIQEKNLK